MKKSMFSTIVFLLFSFYAVGQTSAFLNSDYVYRPSEKVKATDFFDYLMKKEGGLNDVKMVATQGGRSKFSGNHPKFKQTYKGIEVYGSTYTLHLKDGLVNYTTGKIYKDINVEIKPSITENQA